MIHYICPGQPKLDILLARPSRFQMENASAFSGSGMGMLERFLYKYNVPLKHCDIRFASHNPPAPRPCQYRLVLGQIGGMAPLDNVQCYVKSVPGGKMVHSYLPQEADDFTNVEAMFHSQLDEDDDSGDGDAKDTSRIKRANYRFWLHRAVDKLFTPARISKPFEYRIVGSGEAAALFYAAHIHKKRIYLDIETNIRTGHLVCIGWCFDVGPSFVWFPWGVEGEGMGNVKVASALSRAMMVCETVVHNSSFDLTVLFMDYKIPFGRNISDTMLMHHRNFPESEKSLGACISYYLNQPYHKDSAGSFDIPTQAALVRLAEYNARDVHATREIYEAEWEHASLRGNEQSLKQVNRSIYPYLLAGLTGIVVDTKVQRELIEKARRRERQLIRILSILVGRKLNPASPKQVAEYLFDDMEHDVKERSTDKDTLYKLKLKYPKNVALDVLLLLREESKYASMLDFQTYIR